MKKILFQCGLVIMASSLLACNDPKSSGGGDGSGGGGAADVKVTQLVNDDLVIDFFGERISLCSDTTSGQSFERFEDFGLRLLSLKALLCVKEKVEIEFCEYRRGYESIAEPATSHQSENADEAKPCYTITKSNVVDEYNAINESEESFVKLAYSDMVSINGEPLDLFSQVLVRYDQSILNDSELNMLIGVRFSDNRERMVHPIGESQSLLYEDMALWGYEYDRRELVEYVSHLKDSTIQNFIDVTVLSKFIIDDRYEALELFAHASNVNTYSRDQVPIGKDGITTYGLSPLMVAAILADDKAIEILKNVDGIDLNYVSPMLGGNYQGILNGSYSSSHISSAQSGWTSGSGVWGGNGSGGPGNGGPGGGGPGGGTTGGSPSGNDTQSRPRSFCEDCTAVMAEIKANVCSSIQTIVDGNASEANALNSRGESAIDFSRRYNNRCLEEVLKSGTDPRLGGNFLNLAIINGWIGSLNDIPETYWTGFSSENKEDYILSLLKIKDEVSDQQIRVLATGYVDLSVNDNEVSAVLVDNFEALLNSTNAGFKAMNYVGTDLSSVFDSKGLTIFDHFLRKRVETSALFGERNRPFQDRITQFLAINSDWLKDWLNGQSFYGYNPITLSVMYKERRVLVEMLRVPGIDLSKVDQKTDYTALDWAYVFVDMFDVDLNLDPSDSSTRIRFGRQIARMLENHGATLSKNETSIKELQPELRQKFVDINNEFRRISGDNANPTPFETVMYWTRTRD